jgi:hypothetical protein
MSAPDDPAPSVIIGGGSGTAKPTPKPTPIMSSHVRIHKKNIVDFMERLRDPTSVVLPSTLKKIPLSEKYQIQSKI